MAKLGEKPSSGAPLRHRATTENVRDIRRRPHTRPLEGQRKLKWEDKRTGRRSTRTTLALRGEARDGAATPADDEKLRKRRRSLSLGNGTWRSPPGRNDENRETPRRGESRERWAKGNRDVRRGRSDGEAVCAETRDAATSKLKETEGKVLKRSSTMLTRGAMDGGPGPDGAVTAERAKGGPGPEDGTKSEATWQRRRRPARSAEQREWGPGGRRRGRAQAGSRCGSRFFFPTELQ